MINLLAFWPILAADWVPPSRWHELTSIWPEPTFVDFLILLRWVAFLLSVIGLVVGSLWLRDHWRSRHVRSAPLLTFIYVARTLGLSPADCWLLIRIARQQNLPSPLTLILSDNTLQWHGRQYADSVVPFRRSALQRRLRTISACLFDPPQLEGSSSNETTENTSD